MNIEKRVNALMILAKFTGLEVTSEFLRKTGEHYPQAGIPIIHNLTEEIFKPAALIHRTGRKIRPMEGGEDARV